MSSNVAREMSEAVDVPTIPGAKSNESVLDIPKLMSEIRARVSAELAENPERAKPFKSFTAQENTEGSARAGEIVHSEELHFLNKNWSTSPPPDLSHIVSHRKGPVGKLVVKVKKWLLNSLWDALLRDRFDAQNAYNMRVVQLLNKTSRYIDDRDASAFWELVRKIDYDTAKALNRIEKIADEQGGDLRTLHRDLIDHSNTSLRELNERITRVQALAEQGASKLATVESVAAGVERIVARLTRETPLPLSSSAASDSAPVALPVNTPDQSYVMLENRYRGSEEEISRRLSIYPPIFPKDKGPVFEIGAGRGELQLLFRSHGVPSYGIDLDPAMVSAATERGAPVTLADVSTLEAVQDRSLGGVIAIQVVEHLTRTQLAALFDACRRKVAIGGKIVFETINPQSMLALSSNYFRDPTHVWPLHPDTLSFAMTLAGLKIIEIRKLSPVPQESLLKKVPVEEYMTPRWSHAVDTLNRNVEQLNELLYGFQDYAVIAEVV
jgi:O-antigen chain-terminating methyltransferase